MVKNLREKLSGIEFAVMTLHLKSRKGFEKIREGQVEQVVELCKNFAARSSDYDYPMIITGDFNDTPDSKALQKMLNFDKVESVWGEQEPEFTTHRFRHETGMQTRTIDYMFYK